jgi:hypothetical protein
VRKPTFLCGLLSFVSLASVVLGAGSARADSQRYHVAFVDRPLTLPKITLAPYATFDATQLVQDPANFPNKLQTNLGFQAGTGIGITSDLEIQALVGNFQILPTFQYSNPRVGVTYRFVGAENFNMGIRAETTILTLPGQGGVTLQASLPLLVRLGSSARLDLAPGAPITIQQKKDGTGTATSVGVTVPLSLAFQVVEILHIGAMSSATITDFSNPAQNLTVPLGFFAGLSLGSERPLFELDPYFIWTQFAKPTGVFNNNDTNTANNGKNIDVDTFSAGVTARLYLYL